MSGHESFAIYDTVAYSVTDADSRTRRRSFDISVAASSKAPVPAGLPATSNSDGTALVSWNGVSNAHRNRLELATSTRGPWRVEADELSEGVASSTSRFLFEETVCV